MGDFPRLEHIGVVVDDLDAAKAFFAELGLRPEGDMTVEGRVVDLINGLDGVRSDIAMMRTPDGVGCLELIRYRTPSGPAAEAGPPANTPGIRHILFEVADIDDVVARLTKHGGELVGEIAQYEDSYLRGPAGIIVELAEKVG